MQIVKNVHYVEKIIFLLSNEVNSLLGSMHKGSYGYSMIKHLLQALQFVQHPFPHF